jgi:hypothetical protein
MGLLHGAKTIQKEVSVEAMPFSDFARFVKQN